jgi:hypothetical protein
MATELQIPKIIKIDRKIQKEWRGHVCEMSSDRIQRIY